MPSIIVKNAENESQTVTFEAGDNLMELLRDAGFEEVAAICGGSCSCATCHVHILSSSEPFPGIEEDEEMLLELADDFDADKSRLSCQLTLQEDHAGTEIQLTDNS